MDGDIRGVSPIVGVILMVAVTVVLSTVIGAFVMQQTPGDSHASDSAVRISEASDGVHVLAVSLTTPVEVRYNGTTVYTFNATAEGSEYVLPQVRAGDTVTVVSTPDSGSAEVLTTYTVQRSYPVNEGLIAYYPLDALSNGTAVDGVGEHTGYINGSITPADGVVGGGAEFPGSDYIEVTTNPPNPTAEGTPSSFTVSFWASPTSGTGDNPIVEWSEGGHYDTHIWQYNSENDFFLNPQTGTSYEASGEMRLDKFAFYTVVFDGAANESRLYVNGTLVKTMSDTGVPDTNSNRLLLGARYSDSRHFTGTLDAVRIYNRPLNQTEIATLYRRGA